MTNNLNMKRILFCFLLTGTVLCTSAQKPKNIVIGLKSDGSNICVHAIHFDKIVKNYTASPDFGHIGLEFVRNGIFSENSNKGQLGIYDTVSEQLLWKIPIDYNQPKEVLTNNGVLITEGTHKSYYDYTSRDKRWSNICYVGTVVHTQADSSDVLLGYQSLGNGSFTGININNGSELWTAKIYHNISYAGCKSLGGSRCLIIGDKMNLIDSQKGLLASYDINAGVSDSDMNVSESNAQGSLLAGMVGNDIYSVPMLTNSNVITGLNSNVCLKDSSIYFSDSEKLICLDYNLSQRWIYNFPNNLASHSILTANGGNINMLNMGHGLRNSKIERGIPFMASFNSKNGKLEHMKMLSDNKCIIYDAVVYGDRYFFLSDKGLSSRTVSDTASVRYSWDNKKHGWPLALINDTVYAYNQSTGNFAIICHDDYNCPVISSDVYVYMADKDLYINSKFPINDLYRQITQTADYVVVTNGNLDSWIIRKSGVPVMHFNKIILNCDAKDDKLIILTSESDICITDIKSLINQTNK